MNSTHFINGLPQVFTLVVVVLKNMMNFGAVHLHFWRAIEFQYSFSPFFSTGRPITNLLEYFGCMRGKSSPLLWVYCSAGILIQNLELKFFSLSAPFSDVQFLIILYQLSSNKSAWLCTNRNADLISDSMCVRQCTQTDKMDRCVLKA